MQSLALSTYLVTNEFSDRVHDLRNGSDQIVRNLLAYRKVDREDDTEEFWVPPSVFEQEFCNGVNKAELVKELQRIGWLIPRRHDGKSIHQSKINKKPSYYYIFGKRKSDASPISPASLQYSFQILFLRLTQILEGGSSIGAEQDWLISPHRISIGSASPQLIICP